MNRAQAAEKVRKLRALADPSRGGAPAERAVAERMAEKLSARFRLGAADTEPVAETPSEVRTWRATRWGVVVPDFHFNPVTADASDNVEVLEHRGVANWSIVIHDDRIGCPPVTGKTIEEQRKRRLT